MFAKSKAALVAALVVASASAFADDLPYTAEKNAYLRNPNAPVPTYNEAAPVAIAAIPTAPIRGQLIEGRNVGVDLGAQEVVPSDQKHWFDRAAVDFNS